MITGKCRVLIEEKGVESSPLGNWIATKLHYKKKIITLINVYWIPASSQQGLYCSLTQYNSIIKDAKNPTHYRKGTLK